MNTVVNIYEVIKRETLPHLQRTALIEGQRRISYAELFNATEMVAETLRLKGVDRLQRIGLLCDDSIDYVIVSLAILSLSAVIVPVSPEQTAEEIDTVIERIDVDFIIAEPRLRRDEGQEALRSDGFVAREFVLVRRAVRENPPAGYFSANPAFVRFSSGTTGTSKGVMLSHRTIVERTDAADRGLHITERDTVLWVLSMSYHFVVSILLFLRRGATTVLCGHPFPDALIEGLTLHKGTFIYASPFHYSLLSKSDQVPGNALDRVRLAISTSMKLPEQVAEEFLNRFGFELSEAYGIIEVGLPFIRLSGGAFTRGSVGRALPDYEIRLDNRDADGVGEISVRGRGMLDAYYSPWQSRDRILTEGWFHTGDLGKVDGDGFLSIVGRDKDVINFVGMKIFAQEVESVINRHPAVEESLVYGVPHASYGELPTAKIVLRGDVSTEEALDDLRSFCYRLLTKYKVPKEFVAVDALPKTASGKLKR
ncbi:MAG: acyl--CoA ligase [Desulfuromonadales bacterium]|nr:acyl--CoA ligase [Desulfuromonadales bacterium]